jgi:Na+(H+)/acetate symporter ActP
MKLILAALAGCLVGWLYAHYAIATECRKIGKFYVGNSVFVCTEIKEGAK